MIDLAATSLLFVPADRPERFDKALASGAGQVIVDMEDAVAPTDKNKARTSLLDWCKRAGDAQILLRINDDTTEWHTNDLALAARPEIAGVVLPKTTRDSVTRLKEWRMRRSIAFAVICDTFVIYNKLYLTRILCSGYFSTGLVKALLRLLHMPLSRQWRWKQKICTFE